MSTARKQKNHKAKKKKANNFDFKSFYFFQIFYVYDFYVLKLISFILIYTYMLKLNNAYIYFS